MTKLPVLDPLDRRLNVLGDDGKPVKPESEAAVIAVAFTDLRPKPDFKSGIDTQLLFGETVHVFERKDGWARVQAEMDNYVGWLEEATLEKAPSPATHIVCAQRTFFYPGPDLKLPHKGMRSMGSLLRVTGETENRGTRYALLETGEAVIAKHIRPVDEADKDFVAVAESLLNTPYLWAGTTAFGMDCSGLVKLAMQMCGRKVLRDSDMQAATIGEEIDPGENFEHIRRGDIVFWRGHVGICQGPDESGPDDSGQHMLIHANGHSMNVASEPLIEAIERIAYLYEKPIGVRRPGL